jgi:hypothetical protein
MFAHFPQLTVEDLRAQDNAAICCAAAEGQLNVLQWMFAHFPQLTADNDAIRIAAEGDHVEVLQCMFAHFPEFTVDDLRALTGQLGHPYGCR